MTRILLRLKQNRGKFWLYSTALLGIIYIYTFIFADSELMLNISSMFIAALAYFAAYFANAGILLVFKKIYQRGLGTDISKQLFVLTSILIIAYILIFVTIFAINIFLPSMIFVFFLSVITAGVNSLVYTL